MRVLEPRAGLEDQIDRPVRIDPAVFRQQLGEGPPLDALHHDVRRPVLLTDVEDADDVRVREAGRGARLAHEPLTEDLVAAERLRETLDRDITAECLVPCEVDSRHPSVPE
jgi:hypothetical protein